MKKIKALISSSKLIKSGIFVMAASMFVNVINYFYHLVFGRILGPSDYGILASLYSVLYIVSIVPQSTSFAIVKFVSAAKSDDQKRTIYRKINNFSFKVSILLSVTLLIFSPAISSFMNLSSVYYVAIIAPILFLSVMTLVNQATFQGLMEFRGYIVPNILASITKFALGLMLVLVGAKVFGAMVGVLLGASAAYLYSLWEIKKFVSKKTNGVFSIKKFILFALPILIQSIAFTSMFTTDLILVKHFFSSHDAGIYASLSTLGKIIFFAVSPIVAVIFPEISSRHSFGKNYKKVTLGALGAGFAICALVVAIYTISPSLVVGTLYGKLFLEAGVNLPLMAVFLSIYTLSYMIVNIYLSLGKTRFSYLVLVASILQIVGINIFHNSLSQVIYVSIGVVGATFLVLLATLIYNFQNEQK